MKDDISKEIEEKVESVLKEKLVNILTSTSGFHRMDFIIEATMQEIQRNFQNEIQSVLGKELNEAKRQLSYIISPKIVDRVNEFEYQICSLLKEHTESITKFQKETINRFQSEVSPIPNLYIITEKIKVKKRINAEIYVKSKLERKGFKVTRQTCDPGVPDFAIYKKIGEDKNLLDMDFYEIMMREVMLKNKNKEMIQKPSDIEVPVYSEHPLFIEVKTNDDGLRMNQLEWIKKHPDNKVIVYCVEQIIS